MAGLEKMSDQDLEQIAGGVGGPDEPGWKWAMANVDTGYMALRAFPVYDQRNEKAKIVSGTAFQIKPDQTDGEYVYACFNGEKGWVNSKYVIGFAPQDTVK